jgi:hypothetical protein
MMYTRIDITLTVRKLYDMYKSLYAEKAIYFCFKWSCIRPLKSEKSTV